MCRRRLVGRSALFGCGFRKNTSITISRDPKQLVHSASPLGIDEVLRALKLHHQLEDASEFTPWKNHHTFLSIDMSSVPVSFVPARIRRQFRGVRRAVNLTSLKRG